MSKHKENLYYSHPKCTGIFNSYQEALNNLTEKNGNYPRGFITKAEAEVYSQDKLSEYIREKHLGLSFDDGYDAVAFSDGSTDGKKRGGFGLIIFFKDGEVYWESERIEDVTNVMSTYRRISSLGQSTGEIQCPDTPQKEKGYIESSRNETGEFEACRRAMEICFEKPGINNIKLIYDSDAPVKRYIHLSEDRINSNEILNPAIKSYQDTVIKYLAQKKTVQFINTDSHTHYEIGTEEFRNAVFNDMVDAMAKVEAYIGEISYSQNPNLYAVLSFPENITPKTDSNFSLMDLNHNRVDEMFKELLQHKYLYPYND